MRDKKEKAREATGLVQPQIASRLRAITSSLYPIIFGALRSMLSLFVGDKFVLAPREQMALLASRSPFQAKNENTQQRQHVGRCLGIRGTTGSLRGVPRESLVQGWRNRGPEARLFGAPSWVRMGRRDTGDGYRARAGAPLGA